ncbi:OmpA family protein [Vibrio nomapromontoriensis]|uniref:OmpA family protein n=1 Tax=Vibrio nomapromontoriensis TaxID=2910246 RepID=UPI003D1274A2
MKSKLLTFSICLTMSSGAWSAADTIFSTKENSDYFGFSAGYQPTNDYFSPNVIYGVGIAPALVVETRLGYNNTQLNSKHMLARVSLFGHSQFSSDSSFLYGPFIQYEDETNPFRTGFSGVIKHQLDSDVTLFGGISAIVKKESSVRVLPEFILGITWALSASEAVRTRTLEPQPTTSKQPVEDLVVQSTLPPQRDIIEATHVFKVNSSYITNEKVLKESIQYLHQHPNVSIRIVNKHSKGGTANYNKWLGEKRVERLRVFYTENGIDLQRLDISSSYRDQDKLGQPLVKISYFLSHGL